MRNFLITLFLGYFGIHKFMQKKNGIGIVYLFTFGLFGIGWLYDIIIAFLSLFQKQETLPDKKISAVLELKEIHHVAGTSYRQENIQSLGTENSDYSLTKKEIEEFYDENEHIYEYIFSVNNVQLIEEPTNKYDPNAIKVVIDNVHVGYIKRGSCSHVKNLMHNNKITKLEADILGGKSKYLEYNDDTDKYSLRRNNDNFFINLHIYKIK